MTAVESLAPLVGLVLACAALAVSRATMYRRRARVPSCALPRPPPARGLSRAEKEAVLNVLHSERFVDVAPAEVVSMLLDEDGTWICSPRTMYRILDENAEVRERRDQLRHPAYAKPELLASGPNQVWSWDITKLLGPEKWQHFCLYVLLDIFSRKAVGWLLAKNESGGLAKRLVRETCVREGIREGQLTIHSDRGTPMTSKTLAQLFADLDITKSLSRPQVSNDNPFSESQFKTMKYCPEYPDRFASIEAARAFCRRFFAWYNDQHRHSGLRYLTPEQVHSGRAASVVAARQDVLDAAYAKHPERFVRHAPVASPPPTEVYINPPTVPEPSNASELGTTEVQGGLPSVNTQASLPSISSQASLQCKPTQRPQQEVLQ